jgi:CubicO group peptidase (beta-lactamase class C family)
VPAANGLDFDTGITVSNGGLNAPLGDVALYLSFLTDAGTAEQRALYGQVLARSSLEEMWVQQVPVGSFGELSEAMGLCFFLEDFQGHRYVGHTGSQKAFQAFVYIDPAARTGAIAAFNTVGEGAEGSARPATRQILYWVRERMFREIFPLFR